MKGNWMANRIKELIAMTNSKHFRQRNGLPVKTLKPPKRNSKIALEIQRYYKFPGDDTDEKPPDT
jgi:hypothetical protein